LYNFIKYIPIVNINIIIPATAGGSSLYPDNYYKIDIIFDRSGNGEVFSPGIRLF